MSLLATTLLAAAPAALPPAQDTELLSFWITDLEKFFPDPKDAGLLEALRLVDDRILELPDEIPGFHIDAPPHLIDLAIHLMTGEKSLRIFSSNDSNLMFPIYGQLELMENDPERARSIASTLINLGRQAGAPLGEPREDGLVPVEQAPVPVLFGARDGEVILSAGKLVPAAYDPSLAPLPDGVDPQVALHVDVGGILQLVTSLAEGNDRELGMMLALFSRAGLDDMEVYFAHGIDAERGYTTARMPRWGGHMREKGLLPASTLTAADLALIPKDATFASVGKVNFQGTLDYVLGMFREPLAQEGIDDPIQMIAGMTGFDIEKDFIAHLGDTWGVYTSDTTGGGGLLSGVAFVELKNSDGLLDTFERLQDLANELSRSETEGYVQLRSWEQGGTSYLSLTFPGLPIPAEPTFAFTDRYLLMGLTRSTCTAAVRQAKGGAPSLVENPRFQESLPGPIDGALSVNFCDTPRLLRDGYGPTNLLMSALVNGTRSRLDATRDAGVIMPSYGELVAGAKASAGMARIQGDDYVFESRGDRSAMVCLTSTVGFLSRNPVILALPAATLMWARVEGVPGY